MRTAKKMGLASIAVYSDPDANSMHCQAADEAVSLGSAEAAQGYLSIRSIIAAAKKAKADAIHPGYGFLSEDPKFAQAVNQQGMIFVGPPVRAMELAASKIAALDIAVELGIPTLDSVKITNEKLASLVSSANKLGYPLLVKAAAGGGGRGMRIVHDEKDLAQAYAQAKGEVARNFGEGKMFLERWLPQARHVEVQLLADTSGNVAVIGDRDCSLQRRHQKVIEEAPAPKLSELMRKNLHADAIKLAHRMGYCGAGTVEFLVSGNEYFFLEINARIQVEHSVTEVAFAIDIVEQQLLIADGQPLSKLEYKPLLHAIEARVCAEDYENGFLPATGTLSEFDIPSSDTVRTDAGVRAGAVIDSNYDSLMAKVICRDATRKRAITQLVETLANTKINGVLTNIPFLVALLELASFQKGNMTTKTLENEQEAILQQLALTKQQAMAVAAAFFAETKGGSGLRINQESTCAFHGSALVNPLIGKGQSGCWQFQNGEAVMTVAKCEVEEGKFSCTVNGKRFLVSIGRGGEHLYQRGMCVALATLTGRKVTKNKPGMHNLDPSSVVAPMNGSICSVAVKQGARISVGETVATLESMKMEINISAQASGVVTKLLCKPAQLVEAGTLLAILTIDD